MTLDELTRQATDLMSSQQAMPDQGALDQLAAMIRQAYRLGRDWEAAYRGDTATS